MKYTERSPLTKRGIAAFATATALGGGVLGVMIGHASGTNSERDRLVASSPACDIPVGAGDSFSSINAEIMKDLHDSVSVDDLDGAGVARTSANSHGFPNPAYFPREGDTLRASHLPEGVCLAVGGQVLSAAQIAESTATSVSEQSH